MPFALSLSFAVVSLFAQTDAGAARQKTSGVQPTCISARGTRVCGYSCVDSGSMVQCAQTPAGICVIGESSRVACFDPALWLARVYGERLPAPECLSRGGNTVCGYHCTAEGGNVACSQTPAGVCTRAFGTVTCFDPPVAVFGVYGTDVPEPSCVAVSGLVACGYHCVHNLHAVGCSKTPMGVCAENGSIACFDPDKYVLCAQGRATPRPTCVFEGSFACGYDCKISNFVPACAKTPNGTCDTAGDKPVCFDPPVRGGEEACVELIGTR